MYSSSMINSKFSSFSSGEIQIERSHHNVKAIEKIKQNAEMQKRNKKCSKNVTVICLLDIIYRYEVRYNIAKIQVAMIPMRDID